MIGEFDQLGVGVAFTNDSIAYFTQVFRVPYLFAMVVCSTSCLIVGLNIYFIT